MEYSQQTEVMCFFKESPSIGKNDVPGVSLNGRKPEHLKLYFSINQTVVLKIFLFIPSQVNVAESDVEYSVGTEESFLFDEWESGK